jgi:hypothetical protein
LSKDHWSKPVSIRSLFNELKKTGLLMVVTDQESFDAALESDQSAQAYIESVGSLARKVGYFVRGPDLVRSQVEQVLREWGGEEAVTCHLQPIVANAFTDGQELDFLRGEATNLIHEGLTRIRVAARVDRALVESISDALHQLPNNVLADDQRSRENLRELIGPAKKILAEARGNNNSHKTLTGKLPSPAVLLVMAAIAAVDATNSCLNGKLWYGSVVGAVSIVCLVFCAISWRNRKT